MSPTKNRGTSWTQNGGNGFLGALGGNGLGNFDKTTKSSENQSNMWNLARNLLKRSPSMHGTQLNIDKSGLGGNNPLGGLMQARSPTTLFGGLGKMIQSGNNSSQPVLRQSSKGRSGVPIKTLVAKSIMPVANKTTPDSGTDSIKEEKVKMEPESPFKKAMRIVEEERKTREAKDLQDARETDSPFRKAMRIVQEEKEEKEMLEKERKNQTETPFAKAMRIIREEKEAKVAAEAREADVRDGEIFKSKVINTSARPKSPRSNPKDNLRKSNTQGLSNIIIKNADSNETNIEPDGSKAQRSTALKRSQTVGIRNLKNLT
jgi:hypothetical protein